LKDQDAAAIHAQRVMEATLNDIYKDAEKKPKFDAQTLLAAFSLVVMISTLTAMAVVAVFKL